MESLGPMNEKMIDDDLVVPPGPEIRSDPRPTKSLRLPAEPHDPMVSCIMLTCWPSRNKYAHAAIRSFLMQSWPFRELVIVNNSFKKPDEYRLLDQEDYNLPARVVREVMVERTETMTVGDLRNIGLEACAGDWFIAWDDDDWSHPERLEHLMERRQPGLALVPSAHVRYSFKTNSAYVYENTEVGCGNIVLYPRTTKRFPPIVYHNDSMKLKQRGEDAVHLQDDWAGRYTIWHNRQEAHHYLRFFHEGNLCQEQQVMRKYGEPRYHGVWVRDWTQVGYMEAFQTEYLKYILRSQYATKIDGKPWPDDIEDKRRAYLQGKSVEDPAEDRHNSYDSDPSSRIGEHDGETVA